MLTEIKLTNFKCFKEETAIPLSKFNLFTGVNGAGKSTALQALLLMRQSIEYDPNTTELILNGSCVLLGCFDDVRNKEISTSEPILFQFLYGYDQEHFSIHYHLKPNIDKMSLLISEVDMSFQSQFDTGEVFYYKSDSLSIDEETGLYCAAGEDAYQNGHSSILNEPSYMYLANMLGINSYDESFDTLHDGFNFDKANIHFLSADRIGPQEVYKKVPLPDFHHVGTNGEMAVNLLNKLADTYVNDALYLSETLGILGENQSSLLVQTQAWLGKILTPLSLKINPLRVNFLELLIGDSKPSNVGFGYTSILPIIVTGLIAKPGEKIIIENPEIHLHPKAQSALIEFLVKVANTGVQIFIESHSDHVLNALRLATKNQALTPEDVNILFFTQENGNPKVIKPSIDQNGRISQWPEDFFDETAKSLASLVVGQQPRTKAPKG